MIACVACARALSVCRKRRGKKKELSQEARARDQKKRGSFLPLRKPLSLSLSRGGHGRWGGNFFLDLGPEKQKLRVVRYIYVYVRM
jgi:hypothetical protein